LIVRFFTFTTFFNKNLNEIFSSHFIWQKLKSVSEFVLMDLPHNWCPLRLEVEALRKLEEMINICSRRSFCQVIVNSFFLFLLLLFYLMVKKMVEKRTWLTWNQVGKLWKKWLNIFWNTSLNFGIFSFVLLC